VSSGSELRARAADRSTDKSHYTHTSAHLEGRLDVIEPGRGRLVHELFLHRARQLP
jgi:hypothetical protein